MIRGIIFSEDWLMLGALSNLNGWADSAPKGVAQHLRAGTPARMGGVWSVLCTRTNGSSCHGRLHLPGRYINGCMNQYTHIVQSTCPKECRWFVVVGLLSVLHRFSPRFGYILLIVALPYSFIWCVQSSPFLLYSS